MDNLRVIQADFTTWRPVQGRKVVQLVFEVPIEQTHEVMTKLGVPMPGESKWCAIALLQNGACADESADGQHRNAPKPSESSEAGAAQSGNSPTPTNARSAKDGTSQKERKPFHTLPLSQQAAIRCREIQFRWFLFEKHGLAVTSTDDGVERAADLVRQHCQVDSRSKIEGGGTSGVLWQQLEQQYQSWLTEQRYGDLRRG